MKNQLNLWKKIKAQYLREVEDVLSTVNHPRRREILSDIEAHLEQRFNELKPNEKTPDDLQRLIEEMGPAVDYVELLVPDPVSRITPPRPKIRLWMAFASLMIVAGIVFCAWLLHSPAGYIFQFEASDPETVHTVNQLLNAFNEEVRFRVRTHHYRTEISDGKVVGYICSDTKAEKQALANILSQSNTINLLKVKSASPRDLADLYSMTNKYPLVLSTNPMTYSNEVSPQLDKISVTFDQKMMGQSWSWVTIGEHFPPRAGNIYYDSERKICFMPCRLEPGRVYWVGINSSDHENFQTPFGIPARDYVILFATRDQNGRPTPIPPDLLVRAKRINQSQAVK